MVGDEGQDSLFYFGVALYRGHIQDYTYIETFEIYKCVSGQFLIKLVLSLLDDPGMIQSVFCTYALLDIEH